MKKVGKDQAVILYAENNFHGRSMTAVSASTDPMAFGNYGPFIPGIKIIPFDDLEALEVRITVKSGR